MAAANLLSGGDVALAFAPVPSRLMTDNYAVMTGSDQWWVNHLPLMFLLAPVLGFVATVG